MTGRKIPRLSYRASGRTSMHTHVDIHEPKTPDDPDSCLAFSMEGYEGESPAPLIPRYWAPGWNSVQALNKFQAEVGGQLHGGDPGLRLIEPDPSQGSGYFQHVPEPFAPKSSFLVIPIHHIFGSEELSAFSPAVAGRVQKYSVALNPLDAERLGLSEGEEAEVICAGRTYRFPVMFKLQLPIRIAGLPAGFPDTLGITWNEQAEIRKVTS